MSAHDKVEFSKPTRYKYYPEITSPEDYNENSSQGYY